MGRNLYQGAIKVFVTCPRCGIEYQKGSKLNKHLRSMHGIDIEDREVVMRKMN